MGRYQPPRNSVAVMAAKPKAVANSARKNVRNRKPEYSTM